MRDVSELLLSECRSGDNADVLAVHADSAVAARLREFGLMPGARARVVQGGSPMILEIGGGRICLRADELSGVHVQVTAAAAACGVAISQHARELV